jgi:hypothetical protein
MAVTFIEVVRDEERTAVHFYKIRGRTNEIYG